MFFILIFVVFYNYFVEKCLNMIRYVSRYELDIDKYINKQQISRVS